MNLKEELISLIEIIKKVTGKNQAEISLEAGYKEKHLSQIISRDDVSPKVIDNLRKTFSNDLNKEFKVTKSDKDILTELLQLKALGKTLIQEVAISKAARDKVSFEEAIYRLNQITTSNLLTLVG